MRTTPGGNSAGIFVNPTVSVTYMTTASRKCAVSINDNAGNVVASKVLTASEWNSPIDGVIGTVTLLPAANLAPNATYRIMLTDTAPATPSTPTVTQVGTFVTGDSTVRRGVATAVVDQPMAVTGMPASARLSTADVNGSLRSMVASLTGVNGIAVDLLMVALGTEAPNLAKPNARYAVRLRKLSYTSSRADGTPVVLSGFLAYPENADGSAFDYSKTPLLLAQHGSMDKTKAPSQAAGYDAVLGAMAAARGYVYFEPDLIGHGDSVSEPEAYLVAQDTGTASEDMLLAVRDHFTRNLNANLSNSLRIAGASQGGHSAFAALQYVTNDADVKAVYAMSGPYNLFQTFASSIQALAGKPFDTYSVNENLGFVPGHLRSVGDSLKAYKGLVLDYTKVFQTDGSLVSAFAPAFSKSAYPDLVARLGVNGMAYANMAYMAPNARVSLFHYSYDPLVPAQNTVDMLSFLKLPTHKLASVDRGDCYENSAFTKLFVTASDSRTAKHVVCGLFFFDRIVGDL